MPENKRHHFVPQFYLRLFSLRNAGKALGLFNIPSGRFVASANLRKQAYRDYFYGKGDDVEKALSIIEGYAANVIRNIFNSTTIPPKSSEEYHGLILFILFLKARTEYATNEINELVNSIFWSSHSRDPILKDSGDKYRVRLENAGLFSLSTVYFALPLAYDLKCKLLINQTRVPFITSDNPVVFYNKMMELKSAFGSSVGIGSTGLKIFLPLSSRFQAVLYDNRMYKIGRKRSDTIELNDNADILQLNRLQFMSAKENLYFDENSTEAQMDELCQTTNKYRKLNKTTVEEYKSVDNPNEALFVYGRANMRCKFEASFFKLLRKARNFDLKNKPVHLRDEILSGLINDFSKRVNRGQYRYDEFQKFMADKKSGRVPHRLQWE